VSVCSLPRIADFIRDECPVRGLDGSYREQPAPLGAELTDSCVLQVGCVWARVERGGGGLCS
jgi:hypothetical protein